MKRTIFEGTVNGEKFDNVASYNARVNELMQSGEFVSACSNTRVEEIDDTPQQSGFVRSCTDDVCDCGQSTFASTYDEDLSFYPYCDNDDPYYLDLLVTNEPEINAEARKEMQTTFDKCYSYICDSLYDDDVDVESKKAYLEDIREIISRIKQDSKFNTGALVNIRKRREEAAAALKAAEERYDEEIRKLNDEESILQDAKPVIEDFLQYYSAVEAETLEALANHNATKPCKCCDETIKTEVKESTPQNEWDFNKLLDVVFGPNIIRTHLK